MVVNSCILGDEPPDVVARRGNPRHRFRARSGSGPVPPALSAAEPTSFPIPGAEGRARRASARMAQLAAKGHLKAGDDYIHESLIGSLFEGRVEGETNVGDYKAIRPSVSGWARVTGQNTIFVDPDDPFLRGFQVL